MYHDISEKCRYLYTIEQTSREKVVVFFRQSIDMLQYLTGL